ncbi:YidC/Oxa1 family membrane protein insertase [Patescibacteria group bacterium]|nr:YidC/Oxa1 family membrane protein insertase [Patescibacteria group bacterium]
MKRQFILFAGFFLVLMLIMRGCTGTSDLDLILAENDLGIATMNTEFGQDSLVSVKLRNNTDSELLIPNDCPSEPLNVFKYTNGEWSAITATPKITCTNTNPVTIQPKEDLLVEYQSWNHVLFGEMGRYKISVITQINGEDKEFTSNEFTITSKSWIGYLWGTFLYQPIFNALIYLISIIPAYNLGLAIILLTIILRLILFIPAQHGLESQRKMQEIQPRIKKLQEKYKNNQEKLAQETFALYKEYKVNPFGSCLPMLFQLPVLIALFYVIKTGLNPDNIHLLYQPLQGFDLTLVNANFFGLLNLLERDVFVLPIIVAGLQFIQMKLAMTKKQAKQEPKKKKMVEAGKGQEMETATQMMVYVMPVMLALFTASVPSGVGLYWGASTLFGIGQQLYVNKKITKPKKNNSEATVKVI